MVLEILAIFLLIRVSIIAVNGERLYMWSGEIGKFGTDIPLICDTY
jgi:hypothetical protein